MYKRRLQHRVSLHQSGSTTRSLPGAILLLIGLVCFSLSQLALSRPWSAPHWQKAESGEPLVNSSTWTIVLDPVGWEAHMTGELSHLLAMEADSDGFLFIGTPAKQLKWTGATEEGPRASVRLNTKYFRARSELYQQAEGPRMLSGPVEGHLSGPFLGKVGEGQSLDALRLFPRDTERLIWLDTESLRIPESHRKALREEWSRWEFQPTETLTAAFRSPFCYARWRGQSLFLFGVESADTVQAELAERFPDVVMKKTTAWAAGTRVTGFGIQENASWFLRGDFLVATAEGGVRRLENFLEARFEKSFLVQTRPWLLREVQRLSSQGEKGWHLCIIERSPGKALHWALLLRFKDQRARGHLVVEPQQVPQSTGKDSTF